MRLFITASFLKATKKLHAPQKAKLDVALQSISKDPLIGEAKAGDLVGIRFINLDYRMKSVCLLTEFWMKTALNC